MRRRLFVLLVGTFVGIGVGVTADFLPVASPTYSFNLVAFAVLFSPFSVTCGGGMVAIPALRLPLMLGGLLFWPIYFVLANSWLRSGARWLIWAIILWSVQGFFQVVHRTEAMMGVGV